MTFVQCSMLLHFNPLIQLFKDSIRRQKYIFVLSGESCLFGIELRDICGLRSYFLPLTTQCRKIMFSVLCVCLSLCRRFPCDHGYPQTVIKATHCDHCPWCRWSVAGHLEPSQTCSNLFTCGHPPPQPLNHMGTPRPIETSSFGTLQTPSQTCSNLFAM